MTPARRDQINRVVRALNAARDLFHDAVVEERILGDAATADALGEALCSLNDALDEIEEAAR